MADMQGPADMIDEVELIQPAFLNRNDNHEHIAGMYADNDVDARERRRRLPGEG